MTPSQSKIKTSTWSKSSDWGSESLRTLACKVVVEEAKRGVMGRKAETDREARAKRAVVAYFMVVGSSERAAAATSTCSRPRWQQVARSKLLERRRRDEKSPSMTYAVNQSHGNKDTCTTTSTVAQYIARLFFHHLLPSRRSTRPTRTAGSGSIGILSAAVALPSSRIATLSQPLVDLSHHAPLDCQSRCLVGRRLCAADAFVFGEDAALQRQGGSGRGRPRRLWSSQPRHGLVPCRSDA